MENEPHIKSYFEALKNKVDEQYAIAKQAKEAGKDTTTQIECPPTLDLADRTENIIGPPGIAKRYRELYGEHKGDRNKIIFRVFREIIEQKLCEIHDEEKRLEQAVRTCLVLVTEGVVVAPLDGVPQVKISRNPDGSRYVDIYFAGPIRAAGGTATVFPLILGDYARQLMGLDRYKPTEDEVERYVEEINIYDEIITRQYKLKDDEIRKIVRGCPVCINGEPTEEREVRTYKDLDRVPGNRIRGGMCLVVSEGIGLKAMKIMSLAKMLGLNWNWLEELIKVGKSSGGEEKEVKPSSAYLSRVAAGRPIFSYPSRFGGLRLRYGRARNTCVMAKGIHPATMHTLDEFIAVGTQTKMERPGKSAEMFPVDSIEGPIVKLKNGEVRKIKSVEEALQLRQEVQEILFIGDVLITLGDFRKTAHPLMPAGYCEEWWKLDLQKRARELGEATSAFNIEKILSYPNLIDQSTAIELSLQLGVPLHPNYLHYYTGLSSEEAAELVQVVRNAEKRFAGNDMEQLLLDYTPRSKELLERIGLPHAAREGKIVIGKDYAYSFFKTFGGTSVEQPNKEMNVLEMLSRLSGMKIADKAGTFIGFRMGRPEAARPRKMVGDPMVLFPISIAGGNTRSINKAAESSNVEVELAYFLNPATKQIEEQQYSFETGTRNELVKKCPKCGKFSKEDKCEKCGSGTESFSKRKIQVQRILEGAAKNLKVPVPQLVKGVKGLINAQKVPEPIEKGILRARQNLHIFRDGTIRFELLNAPLTHFKPKEIDLSVEKARELGYTKDHEGRELVSEEQLCELLVQDIIVNEEAGNFFLRVTRFVDEELEKFYGAKKHYGYDAKEQLIGELFLGLAPHTSAAVVARIIGYTKAKLNFAHPYFHLAKRRNCFPADTPILVEKGGKFMPMEIGSLDDGTEREEIPVQGLCTYSVLEDGSLRKEKVSALFKRESPESMLEIKTRFGRKITATADHKLLVYESEKIVEKEAEKLVQGDLLLSLGKLDLKAMKVKSINVLQWFIENSSWEEKKFLRVHNVKARLKRIIEKSGGCWKVAKGIECHRRFADEYAKGKWIHTAIDFDAVPLDLFEALMKETKKEPGDFGGALIGYNKQKSTMPAVIPVNRALGELVGYFLADGWARTSDDGKNEKYVYQVAFVSDESEITSKLGKNCVELFGRNSTTEKKGGQDVVTLSGRIYYEFFTRILGTGCDAYSKRVPNVFFNAGKDALGGLLGGYIVGDGHVSDGNIKITSVNSRLVNEFALVCSILGVFPHIFTEKNRDIRSGVVYEYYRTKGLVKSIQSYGIRLYSQDFVKAGQWLFGKKFQKCKNSDCVPKMMGKRVKRIGSFVLDRISMIRQTPPKGKYVYDLMVEGNKTFVAGFGSLGVYDCDGDQDSIMLLMDALLNFSRQYLPSSRGGRMDAPLVFTVTINPQEIDDEVYEVETCSEYPLELYEKSLVLADPDSVAIPIVKKKIGRPDQYTGFGFTHPTTTFDAGPKESSYVSLKSMEEKIRAQAMVQGKVRAVDKKDALERVMASHFMPDIIGNARAFSRQSFRCSNCNAKYRRIPLTGKCSECGEERLILTIAQGSVRKYLTIAKDLIGTYGLSDYLKQRVNLIEKEIDSIFANEKAQQKSLFEFT